jgi:hypothetical protein
VPQQPHGKDQITSHREKHFKRVIATRHLNELTLTTNAPKLDDSDSHRTQNFL